MRHAFPDPERDPGICLLILLVLMISVLFLSSGCVPAQSLPEPRSTEPTFLGDVDGDGYRYHHWRRADGTEYLEFPGRTIDLP